jgi:uncharacterized protein (DUF1697 family)
MKKASNKAFIVATAAAVGEFRFPKAADFAVKAVDKVETIVAATPAEAAAKVETIAVITKASIANPLLAAMFALPEAERPARKVMIATIMEKAGLTKPGAATYLQNFKSKNGFVKPRTAVTA